MKLDRKKLMILIICLLIVSIFAFTTHIQLVGADSGFDSSFDSDFGGSSDWGDSDSSGGGLFYLIYLCIEHPILALIIIGIIVLSSISNNKKQKEIIDNALKSKLELLDSSKFSTDKQLEIEAFNIYKEIQFAWMNFDEEKIQKLTTDEMYNMYLMQLDTLKVKNQKNIMYDIKYIGSRIINRHEENGQETITMNMQVSCYDFIIDAKTNKVVRGIATKLNHYSYEITFVRTCEKIDIKNCPQCGAPVDVNNSGKCEYCKSTLVSKNYTLVMSKKKMLAQK